MTLTDILTKRRSTRRFDGREVPRGVLEGLLRLALTAPSSKNTRSTRFMVVTDPALMAKIAQMRDMGSAFLADAPCAVVVMGTAETDLWVDNAAISATILQLAAEEAGLGSCWVQVNGRPRVHGAAGGAGEEAAGGEMAEDWLRTFLPIPAECKPLCVVALGYPADAPRPRTEKDDTDKVIWL